MRWVSLPGWRALVYGIIIAIVGGLLMGAVFVLSGIYNVGASVRHFEITNSIIRLTLRRSIATHSIGITPPEDLSDEALARLGARHFEVGCAPCHGSPAAEQNPIATAMYPSPPALSEAVEDWQTDELFWIVENGLKFTGMPSWPELERDEEVWSVVAFLERLPGMSAEEYASLAGREEDAAPGASSLAFGPDATAESMAAFCADCHGDADTEPVHPLVPRLGGQSQAYLQRALVEYAEDLRPSGIMQPIAAELGPDAINGLARYYAQVVGSAPASRSQTDPESVRRGGEIALRGSREDGIPACLSCHSSASSESFPRLEGLSAEYIATQLRLFREDIRNGSTYAEIMMPIAQRLTPQQIEDLAAYFASRPRAGGENAASQEAVP